jgi:hypothetical protein
MSKQRTLKKEIKYASLDFSARSFMLRTPITVAFGLQIWAAIWTWIYIKWTEDWSAESDKPIFRVLGGVLNGATHSGARPPVFGTASLDFALVRSEPPPHQPVAYAPYTHVGPRHPTSTPGVLPLAFLLLTSFTSSQSSTTATRAQRWKTGMELSVTQEYNEEVSRSLSSSLTQTRKTKPEPTHLRCSKVRRPSPSSSENQHNRTEVLFQYSMHHYLGSRY